MTVALSMLAYSSCKTANTKTRLSDATAEESAENPDDLINKINDLIKKYPVALSEDAREENQLKLTISNLLSNSDKKGYLQPAVQKLVSAMPQLSKSSRDEIKAAATLVYNTIKVEIDNRPRFDSWVDVNEKLMREVNGTSGMDLPAALEKLSKSDLIPVEKGRLLINGEESWALRKEFIRDAKESIWVFCWAIYNDDTGKALVKSLIDKKNDAIKKNIDFDIRVVVDGPTQSKPGFKELSQQLIDADIGIEFVRWNHPRLRGFGMHRKVMIFDHNSSNPAAIFGGMNYGDNYSHENPALPAIDQWRDTDMVVYGPPVLQAAHYFGKAWNNFVGNRGTLISTAKLSEVTVPDFPHSIQVSEWMLAFIDQDPSLIEKNTGYIDPVYAVTLKMIDSAKESIDISNAYFISSLPIELALKRAMERNPPVQVRVHTNSGESMTAEDKPLLGPIYGSLRKLLTGYKDIGETKGSKAFTPPQVFLQKNHTLHSKFMVVDKMYGWVGSYNIHPRSYRYEGESIGMFYGTEIGGAVHRMFESDAGKSDLADLNKVKLEPSTLFSLLEKCFFEQL